MKHDNLEARASAFLAKRQKRNRRIAWVTVLCLAVVGLTIDFTHREAVTMERVPSCGIEEHMHTPECYIRQYDHEAYDPIYGTIPTFTGSFSVHRHTDSCYDWEGKLICGYRGNAYFHVHNAYCFDEFGNLACGLEEIPIHAHSEECYISYPVLSCGLSDGDGAHVHTDACYREVRSTLPNCGLEENAGHVHTEVCYARTLTCGQVEGVGHRHMDACYTPVLSCIIPESDGHVHTDACYSYEPVCGIAENAGHMHTADCYMHMMTCGIEAGAGAHAHTEACYEDVVDLICGQTEGESHMHTAECYAVVSKLTCGQEENSGHVHTDACFEYVLSCGHVEGEGAHMHDASCFAYIPTCAIQEGDGAHHHDANCYTYLLSCNLEEGEGVHVHTDACYSDTLICEIPEGTGAHMHTETCYPLIWQLSCGQEESSGHVHTDACYSWSTDVVCEYAHVHVHTDACWSYDMLGRKICICGYEEVPVFETTPLDWRYDEVVLDPGHVHDDSCSYIEVLTCEKAEHIHTDACYQVVMTRIPTETGAPENVQNVTESTDTVQVTIPESGMDSVNAEPAMEDVLPDEGLSLDGTAVPMTEDLPVMDDAGISLPDSGAADHAEAQTFDPFSGLSEASMLALGLGQSSRQETAGNAEDIQQTIQVPEEPATDAVTEYEGVLSYNEEETHEALEETGIQAAEDNTEVSSVAADGTGIIAGSGNDSKNGQATVIDETPVLTDREGDAPLSSSETGAQTAAVMTGDNSALTDETAEMEEEKSIDPAEREANDIGEATDESAMGTLNAEDGAPDFSAPFIGTDSGKEERIREEQSVERNPQNLPDLLMDTEVLATVEVQEKDTSVESAGDTETSNALVGDGNASVSHEEPQNSDAAEREENDSDAVSDDSANENLRENEEENDHLTASESEDEGTEKAVDGSSVENTEEESGDVSASEEDAHEEEASNALKDETEQGEKSALSEDETEKAEADALAGDEETEDTSETSDASVTDKETDTDSEKTEKDDKPVSDETKEASEEEQTDIETEDEDKDDAESEENDISQNADPLVLGREDLIVVPLTAEDAEEAVASLQMEGVESAHFMAWNLHLLDETLQADKYEVHMDLPVSVKMGSGDKLEAMLYSLKTVMDDEGNESAVCSYIEAEILFDEEGRAAGIIFETAELSTFVLKYEVLHAAKAFEAEIVLSEAGDIELSDTDAPAGDLQLSAVWAAYEWTFQEASEGVSVDLEALSVIHVQESGCIIFVTSEKDTLRITIAIKEDIREANDTDEVSADEELTGESLPSSADVSHEDVIATASDIPEPLEETVLTTEVESSAYPVTVASESDLQETLSAAEDNAQSLAGEDPTAAAATDRSAEEPLTDDWMVLSLATDTDLANEGLEGSGKWIDEGFLASVTDINDLVPKDEEEWIDLNILASMTDMDVPLSDAQEEHDIDLASQTDLAADMRQTEETTQGDAEDSLASGTDLETEELGTATDLQDNVASGTDLYAMLRYLDGFATLELDLVTITPLGEKEFPADAEGYAAVISDTESLEVAIEEYLQSEPDEEHAAAETEEDKGDKESEDPSLNMQMPVRMMKSAARMTSAQNTVEGKAALSLNNDMDALDEASADAEIGEDTRTDPEENEQITEEVTVSSREQKRYVAFDIGLTNVQTEDYDGFRVDVTLPQSIRGKDFAVYHIHDGNVSLAENLELHGTLSADVCTVNGFSFDTPDFSEFVLSYTVDFAYTVDGRVYQFTLPGGGYITLRQLVEALTVVEDDNDAGISQFVADIKDAVFSDPSLVWVGKTEEETTVGQVKSAHELECEYSADLTEAQIEEINGNSLSAGEWLLISLKAFDTEETLTITMNDGEVFTIKVTDAQEIPDAEKTSIDVNKSYLICYEVGGVYYLLKNDGSVDSAYHPDFAGDPDAEHDFEHLNSTYTWTFNHIFKEQDVEHHLDKNYYLIRPIDNRSKTLTLNNPGETLVQSGNNNVAVIQNENGFLLEGYHNIGSEDEPRYVHLGFIDGAFAGVDGEGVTIHIYEMDSLPTYDYTVRSADESRGTVTVSDGTQQNEMDAGAVVGHYWDATSNHDKQNAGTITATPVQHMNGGQNKWEFDHWELDGLALDRDQYGATINPQSLSIPYNGSKLVAYFRQNPNYIVPQNEKEPSSVEDMTGWLEELQTRNIPLDSSATKKTAEVYDYQNRIYRVDFTSKANFETFAGNIDMAFCLDVSNSMYFPSALVETTSANRANPMPIYQINNSGWWGNNRNWLDTNRGYDNPYYLIADASGTATVFKIYYKNGNWRAIDASRTDENEGGQRRYIIFGDSNYGLSTTYGQDTLHPFDEGDDDDSTYIIYDNGDVGYNRFDYLNLNLGSGSTDLSTITELLKVAGESSPNVKIAYNNTFPIFRTIAHHRQDLHFSWDGHVVSWAFVFFRPLAWVFVHVFLVLVSVLAWKGQVLQVHRRRFVMCGPIRRHRLLAQKEHLSSSMQRRDHPSIHHNSWFRTVRLRVLSL